MHENSHLFEVIFVLLGVITCSATQFVSQLKFPLCMQVTASNTSVGVCVRNKLCDPFSN